MIMSNKENVLNLIAECLEVPASELSYDTNMDDVENWDSMRNVMILSILEDEFDILIPEDDIFDLTTIGSFVDEVDKLLN